ncbi:MAG: signal peptide peptidase SppA [Bacteroidota bacterium]
MNFLKSFLASLLAVIVGFLVAIPLIFIVLGGIVASVGQPKEVTVAPASVLQIKLNNPIVENVESSPFDFDFGELDVFGSGTSNMGLYQIIDNIDKAAADNNIKGIYLTPGLGIQTGWANLSTLRDALIRFKDTGKFIYAYAELMTEDSYYLASVADSIFVAPEGLIEFNGLAANPMFYAGMFEKLDVKPKIFKVGTFKSAVEPYIRKDMSEPSRLQTEKYLGAIWDVFVTDVSASRNIPVSQLNDIADSFMFGSGKAAVKAGLVDQTAYDSEMLDRVKAAAGLESQEKLNLVSLSKYMKTPKKGSRISSNKVAVIFADGTINSGKSSSGTVGSSSVVKALRKARKDENVKAVVLRINSPGGSALASDMMAEEIKLVSEAKPIVASMGNVAASGGYYIAAPCDKIFARPNTITGSIGIFSILWEFDQALKDNLGLTFDEVETHDHSNLGNPTFPLDNIEAAFMQQRTEKGYGTFINIVKEGRKFADSTSVDAIAQGRVWSGQDAKGINLVDEFGDLYDAISYVSEQVGITDDYRVVRYPKAKSPFEQMLDDLSQSYTDKMMEGNPLAKELKQLEEMKKIIPESGTYMLMPFSLEIK